jgi:hypothetical protein
MIGHSHGTVVNAVAASEAGLKIDHFTMLDPPLIQLELSTGRYYKLLPEGTITYVENYIAPDICILPLLLPPPLRIGKPIAGAAPDGGKVIPGRSHCTIDSWYTTTIWPVPPNPQQGFYYSAVFDSHFVERPEPKVWDHPVTPVTIVLPSTTAGSTPMAILTNLKDGDFRPNLGSPQDINLSVFGQLRDNNILLPEHSPSSIITDLQIPPEANALAFDFFFSGPGDGDWLTVSFNDAVLFTFLGQNFDGTKFQHVEVPVTLFAGQTGVLTVKPD